MQLEEFTYAGNKLTFGQINVIHGANGSGKTTLLDAIVDACGWQTCGREVPDVPATQGSGQQCLAELRAGLELYPWLTCFTYDLPETNLGAKLQREMAMLLVQAAHDGIQVFITTHSLFLMRELGLLEAEDRAKGLSLRWRFFGLHRADDRSAPVIDQSDDLDDTGALESLDENLAQSERYLRMEG